MSRMKRIENVIFAILTIICGLVIIYYPDAGMPLILIILGISLVVKGIKNIIYYFTMTRYMVGGKTMLFTGIILLDFGVLSLNLANVPELIIMLYLIGCYIFSGGISVVRALEAKRMGAQSWRLKLIFGLLDIGIALICLFSIRSEELLTTIFGLGLIYTACASIIQSFRKTAIVFIQ